MIAAPAEKSSLEINKKFKNVTKCVWEWRHNLNKDWIGRPEGLKTVNDGLSRCHRNKWHENNDGMIKKDFARHLQLVQKNVLMSTNLTFCFEVALNLWSQNKTSVNYFWVRPSLHYTFGFAYYIISTRLQPHFSTHMTAYIQWSDRANLRKQTLSNTFRKFPLSNQLNSSVYYYIHDRGLNIKRWVKRILIYCAIIILCHWLF